MPKSSTTDIPHAALTDHRILRRPAPPAGLGDAARVQIWREPAPDLRNRDLGLAKTFVGFSKHLSTIGQDGVELLQSLPEQQIASDPEVLSDLEGLALQSHDLSTALAIGKRVVEWRPDSAKAALNYAIVLRQSGDLAEAENQFKRAITLDPSLKQAYSELAMLYGGQQRKDDMLQTLDRYLRFNPQDILFRLQRARMTP
jgi:tetratricopeptide (TPR) repeat protein